MAWSFCGHARLGADAALREVLPEDGVTSRVSVLEWSAEGAREILDRELRASAAVVVIAEDDAAEREALELGASEVVRWPASGATLAARVRRATYVVRLPWLESVLRMVDDSVEITNPEIHLLEVNPAFERITGYSRDEALGKTTGELFRSENQDPSFYAPIGETIERGDVWRGQFTARRHDGSLSFQSVAICEARDALGRTVGHVAVKRDASRDELARSALENAEVRTRSLLERAAEAVLVHGFDGALADVNPAACRILGMERTELLGKRAHELWLDATKDELVAFWSSVGTEPVTREATWRRADGSSVPVELSLARTQISGSDLLLTVARDVSERREAQQRLEALNAQLEKTVTERTEELSEALAQHAAVIDNLADGLLAVDADGHIEMWNPALTAMMPDLCAESWGAPAGALHEAIGELVHQCIRERARCEADLELHDQRTGHAAVSPILVDAAHGARRCAGAVVLLRDVTLERQVDQMKTDFIATVSHELRTPLTSVLGFAKLTKNKLEQSVFEHVPEDVPKAQRAVKQVRGNIDIIVSEGQRLTSLINDVLDISKMEAGRMEWKVAPLEPSTLVDRALSATNALFQNDAVSVERVVESGLPLIEGDFDRLLQVLINLISNAAKFTDEGSVTVRAARAGDGVELSVTDTGGGIAAKDQGTVFEKFRQVGDTLTNKPKGTGLGLPICKQIVAAHGGSISVDSELGKGSTFRVVLPLPEASAPRPRPRSVPPRENEELDALVRRIETTVEQALPSASTDVLVVDDDPSLREMLRQQLSERGYHVRLASNGYDAIQAVRSKRPDVVVLDVMMPEISGFDVAAVLKSDPNTQTIPIIILSIVQDTDRGYRLGVDRYLTKPAEAETLIDEVERVLSKSRAPRRVLVVDPEQPPVADVVRLLETKGFDIVGTCSGQAALEEARAKRPDLIIVESQKNRGQDLVHAIRLEKELENVLVVQLLDDDGT